jgi:hypothetical protein
LPVDPDICTNQPGERNQLQSRYPICVLRDQLNADNNKVEIVDFTRHAALSCRCAVLSMVGFVGAGCRKRQPRVPVGDGRPNGRPHFCPTLPAANTGNRFVAAAKACARRSQVSVRKCWSGSSQVCSTGTPLDLNRVGKASQINPIGAPSLK